MSFKKQVTIIVLNWNGKACLIQCLDALRRQSFQDMITVVVDNGSGDGSAETVKHQFPEVTLISLKDNLGFAVANNIAMRQVDTEYVALLNNDAIAHPLWLENLMTALSNFPEAGFAASKMLYHDAPHIIDRAGDGYSTAGAGCLREEAAKIIHIINRNGFLEPAPGRLYIGCPCSGISGCLTRTFFCYMKMWI